MNVLLAYPEIPDTFWSYSHALRFIGRRAVSPPLGLLTVAAMLPTEWSKRLVGLLQAPPGTRLYQRMAQEQRLRGGSTGDNVDGTTNILPQMGLQTLTRGYARLLDSLYAPRPYYQRIRTFLREYRLPEVRLPVGRMQIRAFVRSIILLGIAGRERWQYWRLLAWTILHRPTLLPTAVRLSILGRHYLQICQKHVHPG